MVFLRSNIPTVERKAIVKRFSFIFTFLYLLFESQFVLAVTEYKDLPLRFTTELSTLKASLKIETKDKPEDLAIPIKKLKIRARKSFKDERIDPVQIYVPRNDKKLSDLVSKVAKKGRFDPVMSLFKEELSKSTRKKKVLVSLTRQNLKMMRLKAIAKHMSRGHHNVTVLSDALNKDSKTRREFLRQIKFFLGPGQRINIARKLKKDRNLLVHRDLLPKFAKKMAKKFVVFRGPNCFHAALAFHDHGLTKSSLVNVKKEKGYHRAMINYDELWRAINRHFYEVDPKKSDLKYGDMLVFYNIPQDNPKLVNFRWIRHTATYLFDQYTFSKGSKSPNTPYTVKTLNEEWSTWQKYTKKLGVRVFRRANRRTIKSTPKDLTDWIF